MLNSALPTTVIYICISLAHRASQLYGSTTLISGPLTNLRFEAEVAGASCLLT